MRAILCDSCGCRIKTETADRIFTAEIRELKDTDDGCSEISLPKCEFELCESCAKRIEKEIYEWRNRPCGIGVE